MADKIGLSEFISKIKEDLKKAQQDSKVFLIDKVELEIQVTASQEGAGEGKGELQINVIPGLPFKIGGVSGTVSAELARQDVHTVKVSLSPAILNEEFMKMLSKDQQDQLKQDTVKLVWLGGETPKKDKFH